MSLIEVLENGTKDEIYAALSARFVKNLEFFSKHIPALSARLNAPSSEYGLWLDDKGVNIANLCTREFLFPEINGRHGMLFSAKNLSQSPLNHEAWTLHSSGLSPSEIDESRLRLTGKMCNDLLRTAKNLGMSTKGIAMPENFLPSTTLLGLAGGLILECLRERFSRFHSLLIFEESLDLFRIACHTVDFPALFLQVSDSACYIFVEGLISRDFVKHFFESRRVSSNFLRLELAPYETPKVAAVRAIINEAHGINSRGWGSFDDEMIGIKNALQNIDYSAKMQQKSVLVSPRRIDAPICVVGNGPSLDSLLPFIKKNQHKMIILSAGTALKPLKNFGISPDFQVEIERVDYLKDVLSGAPLGDVPLLSASVVDPSALNLAKESYLFARAGSAASELCEPSFKLMLSSPFVGNAAFALACIFGSDVLVAGLDCGYIKGAKKHASGSFYGEETCEIPAGAFRVRANGSHEVYSDSIFAMSRENLEAAIKFFMPQMVLNLGDGAYIEGSRSVLPGDFELKEINKARALREFKRSFSKESEQLFMRVGDFGLDEWGKFRQILKSVWKREVGNRAEIFLFIDDVFVLLAQDSLRSPLLEKLIGGSISHFLQMLLVCSLHLRESDILTFFECARGIFLDGIEQFHREYVATILRQRLNMWNSDCLRPTTLG